MKIILGIDPGLQKTGWGLINVNAGCLNYVQHGVLTAKKNATIAEKLADIYQTLSNIIIENKPTAIVIEQIFLNSNPQSTLKLGMARGIAVCTAGLNNIPFFEYSANKIKKSVTGSGHADKQQIITMINYLLPKIKANANLTADAADALAAAICHANHQL